MIFKAKQFILTKNNLKKNLHILKDGASGYANGKFEQVIAKILFKTQ